MVDEINHLGDSVTMQKASKRNATSMVLPFALFIVCFFSACEMMPGSRVEDSTEQETETASVPQVDPVPVEPKVVIPPVAIDYERVKSIVNSSIDDFSSRSQANYQFICDENERWIYRCNMITGEIECFSMTSNKLMLLSSIK